MNKKKIVDRMIDWFYIINRRKLVKNSNKHYFKMLKDNNIPIKKLTKEQKKKVDDIYKKYGFKYSYKTHELVYSVTGEFSPGIVPEDMFRTEIEIYLNPADLKYVMTDKNYFDVFMSNVKFPNTIVRNIDGMMYDADYNMITTDDAKNLLNRYDEVVFKPSVENGFGRGVTLVRCSDENPLDYKKDNYIVQERLIQHPKLAELNESSVNVCRIATMFIDGEVFVITAAIRIGAVGAFTDNSISKDGKGMIIVGIDENGKLRDTGYHSCGLKVKHTPGGINFDGVEVPKFSEMIEIAKKAHSCYPRLKFIAWDFSVDENNNVVCLEYNAKGPGVLYYQYVNGPLFGDYADKIFAHAKKLKEKKSIF